MRGSLWRLFSWAFVMLGLPLLGWLGYSTTADTYALSMHGIAKEAQVLAHESTRTGPRSPSSYYYRLRIDERDLSARFSEALPVGGIVSVLRHQVNRPTPAHRKADSLDRVEILMSLEAQFPELGAAFETLWELDPDFNEKTVFPLKPYICAPVGATAVRGGIATQVTVFARKRDRVLALDHDCNQLAIGTITAERRVVDVRHYRTLELGFRAFLSETL